MERQSQFVRLHPETIGRLIQEQELKKWWVAESAGVHKTTLRRWLSGRITKVREDHAGRLAEVLTSTVEIISEPVCHQKLPHATLSEVGG